MDNRIAMWLCVLFISTTTDVAAADRHRAVKTGVSSSEQLIAAALASGKISAETALTYRVFAAFSDCRLPGQFRGDDSAVQETDVLGDVAATFSSLSPAAQATLAPFLVEPYSPGGWMQLRDATCTAGKTIQPNDIATNSLFAVDGKVRIIYRTDIEGEAARAQSIKAELEKTIYGKLTALMGEPLAHTDNTRWHLSLIAFGNVVSTNKDAPGYTDAVAPACKQAAAFSAVGSHHPMLLSIVAHELMHATQYAYDVHATCMNPTYKWIKEATATWAQDFVYPNPPPPPVGDSEHVQAVHFMAAPEEPLDCVSETECRDHEYGAYLLPFYIHRRYNDSQFVRRIWDAAKSNAPADAVDVALGPFGGFEKEWPEFARYNWNREPYDDYQKWDHLTTEDQRASADDAFVSLGGSLDRTFEMNSRIEHLFEGPMELQSLSAQYFHYTFGDSTARSVGFLNGINFKLSNRVWSVVPDFGPIYVFDNAAKPRKGLKIQALLKINGTWETTPRDWTQIPFVAFCRDVPAERLDELVLIYSNSNFQDRDKIAAEGITPTLAVSNMGCSGWKTVDVSFQQTNGVLPLKITWSAALRRTTVSLDYVPMPTLPPEGTPVTFIGYSGTGDVTWSMNGPGGACSYAGGATVPMDLLAFATWNFTPPGAIVHRAYGGAMGISQLVHFLETCGSAMRSYDQNLPGWSNFFDPEEIKRVSSDGINIRDEHDSDFDRIGKFRFVMTTNPP